MQVRAFYHKLTHTLSYAVWDTKTRAAVVIDPVLDYDPLASQTSTEAVDEISTFLRSEGLGVSWVLETHAHADHVSAAQVIKQRFGAKVAIGERIADVQRQFKALLNLPEAFATDGRQFDKLLKNRERLAFGTLEVEAISSPGHTPACVSYRVGDALFTGDALFMDDYGTGRCDFPGGSAEALYHSVHEVLYALPEETRVFVGHDYQPNARELLYQTTIGQSKHYNRQLRAQTSEAEFVRLRHKRDAQVKRPDMMFQCVQLNIDAGRLPRPAGNGRRYLSLPINLFEETNDVGEPLSSPPRSPRSSRAVRW